MSELTARERAVCVMRGLVAMGAPYVFGGRPACSESVPLPDGTSVAVPPYTDCSGAVIVSWEGADPGCTGGAGDTGNMRELMCSTGKWAWHPRGDGYEARAGDVWLYEKTRHAEGGHTAMCTAPGLVGEEYPPRAREVGWYDYGDGWDGVLEYLGDEEDEMTQEQVEQVAALAAQKVWEYAWYNAEGENTAPGGNMYNNIVEMRLLVEAQSAAMAKLAEVAGADPGEIAKAVSDAVAAKLEGISLSVEVAG